MPATNQSDIETCVGNCPSCGKNTTFTFIGIQKWPAIVAAKRGLPLSQKLWLCSNCDSTIMSSSLEGCD